MKERDLLKTEEVFSPIEDINIQDRLSTSPIWQNCYKEEDLQNMVYNNMYKYTIKFDGLKAVQCTKIEKI